MLDRLRYEAEERNVSVNAIASSIFTTHYKWTAAAPRAGMVPIHKALLAMLLEKLSDDEIASVARLFAEAKIKDMTLVLRNDYNLAAFLDVVESWMSASSVSFDKNLQGDHYRYIISHEIGRKWSAFLSLMLQGVFAKMGVDAVSFDVTDSTIMFSIQKIVVRAR